MKFEEVPVPEWMTELDEHMRAQPRPVPVDLVRRQPKGYNDHADHVLVIERCHPPGECPANDPECWDYDWEVLHPPTCHRASDTRQDPRDQGPDYRCGADYELAMTGWDYFDHPEPLRPDREKGEDVFEHYPAGRYLFRWWWESGTPRFAWDDERSGFEPVQGPVPDSLMRWS